MNKLFLAAPWVFASPAWASTEWVQGIVVKLDPARSRVTLKHSPIKSVKMDAMTMPFKVRHASLLASLKVGDPVRFEVLEEDSELVVQQIEVHR